MAVSDEHMLQLYINHGMHRCFLDANRHPLAIQFFLGFCCFLFLFLFFNSACGHVDSVWFELKTKDKYQL